MTKTLKSIVTRVIREEKGAEGLEKLLIIGAIAIPLLGLLIFFADAIRTWVTGEWETVEGNQDLNSADDNPF